MKILPLFLSVVLAALVACADAAPTSPASQFAGDPEAIARGEGIFRGVCGAYCHGLTPDNRDALYLFDCTWKNGASDAEIFQAIAKGIPGSRMLGFGDGLSDEDIWKVIAFLRSKSDC